MKTLKFLIVFAFVVMSVNSVLAQPPENLRSDEYIKKGKKEIISAFDQSKGTIQFVNERKDYGFIEDINSGERLMFVLSNAKAWYPLDSDKIQFAEGCFVKYYINHERHMAILLTIQ